MTLDPAVLHVINRVPRTGPRQPTKHRAILVNFAWYEERRRVLAARFNLGSSRQPTKNCGYTEATPDPIPPHKGGPHQKGSYPSQASIQHLQWGGGGADSQNEFLSVWGGEYKVTERNSLPLFPLHGGWCATLATTPGYGSVSVQNPRKP